MNFQAQTLHPTTTPQRRVHGFIAALRSKLAAWQRRQHQLAALRELQALDDHMLRDIGVTRDELPSLVAELMGASPATRRRVMER